jgi:hypothetical protein
MELSYQKNDNSKLFSSLVKSDLVNVSNIQNYVPLYSKFFALTNTNFNSINLKQGYSLYNITSKHSENIFQGKVKDNYGNTHTKDIFFKYSPLLDPVKYMIGKYHDNNKCNDNTKCNDASHNSLFNLPTFINNHSHEKMRDVNNSAYIDSFFSFLSSQMLHHHGFIHGLDFYGSYVAIKNDFMVNVCDDMDYLTASPFFKKNLGNLFTLDHTIEMPNDTRTYKEPIKIVDTSANNTKITIELADIHDLDELDKLLVDAKSVSVSVSIDNSNSNDVSDSTNALNNELTVIYNQSIKREIDTENKSVSSGSTCSSRSSNTNSEYSEKEGTDMDIENDTDENNRENSDDDERTEEEDIEEDAENKQHNIETDNDNEKEEEDESTYSDYSSSQEDEDDDEDNVMAKIKIFPIQLIALENCENTLDSLITHTKITDDEWDSVVIQILMSLITFQKVFHFTHNDLHTNNIMYIKTDIAHLHYKVNNKYYKVPTFGRIFKIIDFGRAIYKFRKATICSDSFSRDGDASTQYNCEPYMNSKKPRLDPNMSFDLCRLGCSLFDIIVDDYNVCNDNDVKCADDIKSPILRIIMDWCLDDKKRNVLYKNNGEERYPDFKLYKMIARTVHNHVPLNVLQKEYFDKYVIDKKKMKKNVSSVIDIDALPCYI